MKTIILAENALDPSTWETFEAEDVREFLMTKFDKFPDTARIYHKQVAESCDVTPSDEWGIKRLAELEGPFYVVVYPGDPVTIIVAVVAVVAVAAAVYLLRPSVPTPSLRNTQSESPNNELSDRQNRPRPNGRVPDIFGTVRSTPDLLAVPYKVFENHEEVEYAYMCIGRGEYDIPSAEIKDDTTLISDIAGASVEVFGPFTSPNSGDDPQLRVGTAISEPLYSAVRSNAVNGQVLRAPNSDSVSGNDDIKFVSPDEIRINSSAETDFTTFFAAADVLTISNASYTGTIPGSGVSQSVSVRFTSTGTIEFETTDTTAFSVGDTLIVSGAYFTYNGGVNAINLDGTYVISGKTSSVLTLSSPENINTDWNLIAGNFTDDKTDYKTCGLDVPAGQTTIDLSGTYTILSVSSSTIVLSNPSSVNSDWNTLANFTSGETAYISPILSTSGSKWVGPFTLDSSDLDKIFSNFVALNGLYKDDGEKQIRFDVTVELELTPVDASGTPTGSAETFQGTIQGSAKTKSTRAITVKANPTFTGRCEVRARRVTNADLDFEGSVIDEIKWRDVYAMSPVVENDFGNVTTVHSVTYATAGALAVKDRKLNMLVTRKLPEDFSKVYDFATTPTDWGTYGDATAVVSSGEWLTSYVSDGLFGTYVQLPDFLIGDYLELTFDLTALNGGLASINVALHEYGGGGISSNLVTYNSTGTKTIRFVATRNAVGGNARILFYGSGAAGRSFAIDNVSIDYRLFGKTAATNTVDEVLKHVCLDRHIGNRLLEEIDVANIQATVAEINEYFGSNQASEFNYTFDTDNVSFEETVASIASAVFCNAYRRGNVIKLKFERATEDSTLLFNHRNKLPGTETRTVRFGNQDDNDGVEYEWVDPEDDAIVTLYIPEDKSAVNPKKIESLGVRNYFQAFSHAWRIWNKIQFQHVATEFEATQEADILVLSDRILVADNTRPGTQDGEVISQNGLSLELSQEIVFDGGETYTIFIQHIDGSVESMPVSAGASSRFVTLSRAPKAPLALDDDFYARALYQIVGNSSKREQAFIMTEKQPQTNFTSAINAINYDFAYYMNDSLLLWIDGKLEDSSALEQALTLTGTPAVVSDYTRGNVIETSASERFNLPTSFVQPDSYTKAVWADNDVTDNQHFLRSVNEGFYLNYQDKFGASHNGTNLIAPLAYLPGTWRHYVVTYDADTTTMKLFVNGEKVAESSTMPQRTKTQLYGPSNYIGRTDDLRLFARALDEAEVKALYRKTL